KAASAATETLHISPNHHRKRNRFAFQALNAELPHQNPFTTIRDINPHSPTSQMKQSLGLVSLVVRDYDEALAFFVGRLGFLLVQDSPVPEQEKRWVVIAPPG